MHDLIAIAVSIALPWLAGACCVLALQRDAARRDLVLAAGYGYLLGALATTLAMRALDAMAVRWTAALIALQLLALAAIALGFCRSRSPAALREHWRACRNRLTNLPPPQRLLFFACLALIVVRLCGLGLELAWRPLLPWDAWAQWATKARVWYEYGRLAAFVNPAQWLESGSAMQFVDAHPDYPGTVPLLQVWTALCLGRWDESLMNVPWLAILSALGFGFYAQLRRLGTAMAESMLVSYLLLSIPFVDLHVAVAGYVDIFIAAAYGMAAMAFAHWTRTRERTDAVLALVCAIACIAIKKEGILWALTLLPPVLVAIDRRVGLRVVALLGAVTVMYLLFGPREVDVLGYTLRTQFSNVSRPLFEHLFVMDNWHLLWYVTLAVIALRWRAMLSPAMAPMTILMLGAFAFVFVVFFYSSAAFGVIDETLVNRLPLHMVPALAFYLAMLWQKGSGSGLDVQVVPARVPAR
ncbi:MAG TPA: hypothetical protein VGK37_07955 [Casimicrobiaceae bacterium]